MEFNFSFPGSRENSLDLMMEMTVLLDVLMLFQTRIEKLTSLMGLNLNIQKLAIKCSMKCQKVHDIVSVAIWMRQNGYVTGCPVGDTIPYTICCEQLFTASCISASRGQSTRIIHSYHFSDTLFSTLK